MAKLGIRFNQRSKALSQYAGWLFDSMAEVHGVAIGVNEDGIFRLWDGDTDDGANIEMRMDLPETDLGTTLNKRLRSAFIACRADGEFRFVVTDDEEKATEYPVHPLKEAKLHVAKVAAGRNFNKGCFYTFSIRNFDGSDVSVESVDILPILLDRTPGVF